jgi:flagellar basal body P-ring protein FlgI
VYLLPALRYPLWFQLPEMSVTINLNENVISSPFKDKKLSILLLHNIQVQNDKKRLIKHNEKHAKRKIITKLKILHMYDKT